MFRIEMLPAAHGDCLWIEYGTGGAIHRMLIDGGPAHTYPALRERLLHLPEDQRSFDLLVVTHIDADHIEGVVRLLQDAETLHCRFDRIWFNGREQLNAIPDPTGQPLGAVQGEYLSLLIRDYEARMGSRVWNAGLPRPYVGIDRAAAAPVTVDLPGDLRLTLLSPDLERLFELKIRWDEELRKAKVTSGDEDTLRRMLRESRQLKPLGDVLGEEDDAMQGRWELPDPAGRDLAGDLGDALGDDAGEPGGDAEFGGDDSRTNGSSIALLAEYPKEEPETRVLLAGDAWAPVLERSIDALAGDGGRLKLDVFKVPHHGSVGNLDGSLLSKLECKHYLLSTSGAVFRHPHSRAVNLLLDLRRGRTKPRLHFNYRTETTVAWADPADQKARRYEAFHPMGISLEFS